MEANWQDPGKAQAASLVDWLPCASAKLSLFSFVEACHLFVLLSLKALRLCILFSLYRCFTGYTGERCEHLTLTSYAVDSYEKYIAIGIAVGLLISAFLAVLYCYVRKRYGKYKALNGLCGHLTSVY